ncbi:SDR family NAD(P)-dependent oxidoreductase [Henriciella aquimarina]|uniref:SDR family NAD(P)-dependent oxidoreductase n=1 Tax=Henriciella aquimarina TaxID=545261 RepID=UPI001F20399F|nr:SDR family oxidoreductase [Henriciella aquimarina]
MTGAGSGLGRQFARALAHAGARVHLAGRRPAPLLRLRDELTGQGCSVSAAALDICDAKAIEATFDLVEETHGRVNILVNNAGIADADFATRLDLEKIDQVIATNFRAPFLLCRETARRLIEAEEPGRIVNIASVGAYHYTPSSASALYCATKAGVVRLTETLALEWAKFNINVNAIAPGMFYSEMTDDFMDRVGDRVIERTPRKRIGDPAWLESTLLYLVDPRSHFITGTCVVADDAQVAR